MRFNSPSPASSSSLSLSQEVGEINNPVLMVDRKNIIRGKSILDLNCLLSWDLFGSLTRLPKNKFNGLVLQRV